MKWRLACAFILFGSIAHAQNSLNLQLPSPSQNYQSDSFSTDGMNCSNAIGSATNLEFGVTGIIDGNDMIGGFNERRDVGVFARITIPLGNRNRERINCNTLYELELRQKRLEILRLEQELRSLQNMQLE